MTVIPKQLRGNLRLHRYQGTDLSLVSKYIMQPFWTRAVNILPCWMHPNLVTLLGFAFIAENLALVLYFSPTLETPLPAWCLIVFAINFFLYQTLDALDGKQARRTGQSGPLGELFDHGCDALNTGLMTVCTAPFLASVGTWAYIPVLTSCFLAFYSTTLETYHTGVLFLGYASGPVEGVLTICISFFVFGLNGLGLLPSLAAVVEKHADTVRFSFAVFTILFALTSFLGSAVNMFRHFRKTQNLGKACRSLASGYAPLVAYFNVIGIVSLAQPRVFAPGHMVIPATLGFTLIFGEIVGRIVVSHCCADDLPHLKPHQIILLSSVIILAVLFGEGRSQAALCTWALLSCSMLSYSVFAKRVIHEICEEMDIWCFTIKPKTAQAVGDSKSHSLSTSELTVPQDKRIKDNLAHQLQRPLSQAISNAVEGVLSTFKEKKEHQI